jgi:hypothetical protein
MSGGFNNAKMRECTSIFFESAYKVESTEPSAAAGAEQAVLGQDGVGSTSGEQRYVQHEHYSLVSLTSSFSAASAHVNRLDRMNAIS